MSGDDRSLRRAFDVLKSEDADRTPEFTATMSRVRARASRRRRIQAGGATVIAIAATTVFAMGRSLDRQPSGALAAKLIASEGMWRGPTDFLLERGPEPLWRSTETLRETLSYTRRPQ